MRNNNTECASVGELSIPPSSRNTPLSQAPGETHDYAPLVALPRSLRLSYLGEGPEHCTTLTGRVVCFQFRLVQDRPVGVEESM